MHPTRRDFLRLGLGTSTLLACGATVPTFLANAANALAAERAQDADGRILVVLQLDGGNDGPVGWRAREIDPRPPAPGGDVPALHISGELLPQALVGSPRHVPSFTSLEQFRRRLGVPESAGAREQRTALDVVATEERG